MLRKSFVPLLLAVLLGLGAAYFAQSWMQDRLAVLEQERREGASVVVAAIDIPFGQRIEAKDLALQPWPRDSVPEGAYSNVADLVGKTTAQRIVRGEPILASRASQTAAGSSLAALIEPGKRAVTVRVNDVVGVAGFLLPGNRVDVLASRNLDAHKAQTRTVLQNVKVLAVDQTSQPEKDQPVVVRAVTLEVTPVDAQVLVQATEEGTVQLALRNPDTTEVVAFADDSTSDAEPAPAATPPPAAEPAPAPAKKSSARRKAAAPAATQEGVTEIRQTQVSESKTTATERK